MAAFPQERIQLHRNDASLVPVAKVKEIFRNIKNPTRRGKKIVSVNDFLIGKKCGAAYIERPLGLAQPLLKRKLSSPSNV